MQSCLIHLRFSKLSWVFFYVGLDTIRFSMLCTMCWQRGDALTVCRQCGDMVCHSSLPFGAHTLGLSAEQLQTIEHNSRVRQDTLESLWPRSFKRSADAASDEVASKMAAVSLEPAHHT